MRRTDNNIMGLREVRLEDKRLALLPSADSRFRAAAVLVDFYAKQSGAQILSWCVEGEEVIVMAHGGVANMGNQLFVGSQFEVKHQIHPHDKPNKDSLLRAAAKEEQKAQEYEKAYSSAQDHYTAMGYLDLATEAKAAATALTAKASHAENS
jgi:hypothetical protein